jgi:hypothetical protein
MRSAISGSWRRNNATDLDRAPFGYCELIPRDVLQSVRCSESVQHYAQTGEIFVADCKRHGLATQLLKGLVCLHLEHPFAWYETDHFL